MRNIIYTEEFGEFYNSLPGRAQTKLLYALNILATLRVVSTKLVKKLVGSDFYELRVSVGNEYRVIMFSVDNENIIEATCVILLNGFMKKSTKDYGNEINKAMDILKKYETKD